MLLRLQVTADKTAPAVMVAQVQQPAQPAHPAARQPAQPQTRAVEVWPAASSDIMLLAVLFRRHPILPAMPAPQAEQAEQAQTALPAALQPEHPRQAQQLSPEKPAVSAERHTPEGSSVTIPW